MWSQLQKHSKSTGTSGQLQHPARPKSANASRLAESAFLISTALPSLAGMPMTATIVIGRAAVKVYRHRKLARDNAACLNCPP